MINKLLFKTLGLDETADMDSLKKAYEEKIVEIDSKIEQAPTDALKQKFAQVKADLAGAYASAVLESVQAASPMSQTQMADLPQASASYTQFGEDGEVVQLALRIGDVLANRYQIKELIGAGGMGAVYRAFDQNRQQEIAIKVLLPHLVKSDKARERFLNEARLSSDLSHPNIVNVYDVQFDGDYAFITMELLEGQNLRAYLDNLKAVRQEIEVEEAVRIVSALCDALSYAHETTVHRDIKPENIWLTEDGKVKLMDFGIARVMSASHATKTGTAMGTAYYMAPEQLKGSGEIDARADQYSLGVLLYEMLAGEIPAGRVKSLFELRKDVSKKMSDSIDKALSSDRKDRYQSLRYFSKGIIGIKVGNRRKPLKKNPLIRSIFPILVFIILLSHFLGESRLDILEEAEETYSDIKINILSPDRDFYDNVVLVDFPKYASFKKIPYIVDELLNRYEVSAIGMVGDFFGGDNNQLKKLSINNPVVWSYDFFENSNKEEFSPPNPFGNLGDKYSNKLGLVIPSGFETDPYYSKELLSGARMIGFKSKHPIRQVPLVYEYDSGLYPSFSLAVMSAVLGQSEYGLELISENNQFYLESLSIGEREIALGERAAVRIGYGDADYGFSRLNGEEILKGNVNKKLKNKVVIIDMTGHDVVLPRRGSVTAGELEAHIISSLMHDTFKYKSLHYMALELLYFLLVSLFVFMMLFVSVKRFMFLSILLLVIASAFDLYKWQTGVIFPFLVPVLYLFVMNVWRFFDDKLSNRLYGQS